MVEPKTSSKAKSIPSGKMKFKGKSTPSKTQVPGKTTAPPYLSVSKKQLQRG